MRVSVIRRDAEHWIEKKDTGPKGRSGEISCVIGPHILVAFDDARDVNQVFDRDGWGDVIGPEPVAATRSKSTARKSD